MQTLVKHRTNNLVYILGAITAIIFLVSKFLGLLPLFLLGIAIMLLTLVFFEFDDLFLYAIILFPFLHVIKISDSSIAFYSYYFILVAIKYFIKNEFNFKFCFSILVFFICVVITSIKYNNYNLIISELKEIISIIFLLTMFNFNSKYWAKEYVLKLLMCVNLGATIFAISFILGLSSEKNFSTITFPCLVAINLLIGIYNKKLSLISFLSMLILAVGSLMTSSRTNFLVLLLVVLIPVFSLFDKRKIKYGIYSLIIIVVIVGLIIIFFSDVIIKVLDRFEEDNATTGNGRTEIWKFYINLTCSSWDRFLFGNGYYTNYLNYINFHEHNSFVQVFSQFGIVGTIAWGLMYFNLFKQIVLVKGKFKISFIVPFLCFIGCNMGVGNMGSTDFVCLYLCCCLTVRCCSMSGDK